jgi:hypothetical protein
MGKVVTAATVSLDGYIAGPNEITLQLVPVLLGGGVPLFEHLAAAPILLDGPTFIVQGNRVTHLRYTVRRP